MTHIGLVKKPPRDTGEKSLNHPRVVVKYSVVAAVVTCEESGLGDSPISAGFDE